MSVTLSLFAGAGAQFFDNNGNVLSGGKIYTYQAGTTTPLATYTSNSESAFHTNPIILDSAGRVPSGGEIWLQLGIGYKFVLRTSTEVLIATYDNIPSSAQPPAANDADSIMYEQGYTVTAGSFVAGKIYRIVTIGTTDFTLIGATANSVGLHFIATGAGTGTGTAELSQTIETKLREFVSVTDFGADPTGASNSTAAIAAAFAASTRVSFPNGSYLMNSGVTVLDDNIEVDFGNATIINGGAGFTFVFGATADTPQNTGLRVTGGYFTQSNPSTTSNLNYIRVAGFSNFTIAGCNMKNVSNGGIYIEAGCENGLIDGVTINGASGYSTNRGIWLNGATASDWTDQLVDISSITRNSTPVPVYAVKNVRITNCSIVLAAYGIYNMNTRDTHIENCYIDVSGSGLRCIAINSYSPGALIKGNTLKGDRASTGILVTQFSHDVIIEGNTFLGSFGGGRDIYVQYLADCQITNNKFNTDSTQQILINMGATAIIRGNYFTRPSGVSTNVRCVLMTTIDEAFAGTSTFGNTATTLAGITFANNVVKNRLSVVSARALTAANGNIPGLDTVNVRDNIFYNFDLATGGDEYGLKITAPGTTYTIAYSYFNNTVYPAANAGRNRADVAGGTGAVAIRTDVQLANVRIAIAAGGGSFLGTKLYGGYFACDGSVSLPSNTFIMSPRTIDGVPGAAVAIPLEIVDVSGVFASYDMIASGSNYTIRFYDSAGTIINLTTTAVTFDVVIAGSAT
jgi:hypothetical protein